MNLRLRSLPCSLHCLCLAHQRVECNATSMVFHVTTKTSLQNILSWSIGAVIAGTSQWGCSAASASLNSSENNISTNSSSTSNSSILRRVMSTPQVLAATSEGSVEASSVIITTEMVVKFSVSAAVSAWLPGAQPLRLAARCCASRCDTSAWLLRTSGCGCLSERSLPPGLALLLPSSESLRWQARPLTHNCIANTGKNYMHGRPQLCLGCFSFCLRVSGLDSGVP
jgi:hypothetical protein